MGERTAEVDGLDLDDPKMLSTIYHGSSSEVEMVALSLLAELRRERERRQQLEGGIREIAETLAENVAPAERTQLEHYVAAALHPLLHGDTEETK